MEQLALLLGMAFLVESLTEYFFGTWINSNILKGVALAMGVAVALLFNIDMFVTVGLNSELPYVGAILTGIVLSRGSDFLHQLYNSLTKSVVVELGNVEGDAFLSVENPAPQDNSSNVI